MKHLEHLAIGASLLRHALFGEKLLAGQLLEVITSHFQIT